MKKGTGCLIESGRHVHGGPTVSGGDARICAALEDRSYIVAVLFAIWAPESGAFLEDAIVDQSVGYFQCILFI